MAASSAATQKMGGATVPAVAMVKSGTTVPATAEAGKVRDQWRDWCNSANRAVAAMVSPGDLKEFGPEDITAEAFLARIRKVSPNTLWQPESLHLHLLVQGRLV